MSFTVRPHIAAPRCLLPLRREVVERAYGTGTMGRLITVMTPGGLQDCGPHSATASPTSTAAI